MTFINDVRNRLGVDDAADEATTLAALDEALAEQAEPTTPPTAVPDGMTLIEDDVLAELRSGATAGATALERQRVADRDSLIAAAIADGRTSPARRAHWQSAFDADPQGAAEQLSSLAPGLIPTSEAGHGQDDPDSETTLETIRAADDFKNWSV